MSHESKSDAVISALRALNPTSAEALRSEETAQERERGIREAIARSELSAPHPHSPSPGHTAPAKRWMRLALGGAALTTVAIGAGILVFDGSTVGGGPTSAYAETAVEVAEEHPRLLMDAPGWHVSKAYVSPEHADTTFTNGDDQLLVLWLDVTAYPFDDPGNPVVPDPQTAEVEVVTAQGERAALVRADSLDGDQTFVLIFEPRAGHFVKIYSGSQDEAGFLRLVDSMYSADVDTWLAALPPDVVKPEDNRATVDAMLDGIPIPANVDIEELRSEDLAMTREQLGMRVSGAAACGWLSQWADAVESGDQRSAQEAVDAMATAEDWPVLREGSTWSAAIWGYAEQMTSDPNGLLAQQEAWTAAPGAVGELERSYAPGLGCSYLPVGK